jgi:hypothetical protein
MADNKDQPSLFGDLDQFSVWWDEWVGMPELIQEDLGAWKQLIVSLRKICDHDDEGRQFRRAL